MEIELLTKKDLAELTDRLILIQQQMKAIYNFMDQSKNRVIDASAIRQRLGISYSTFLKRRSGLMKFGMYNDGKWKMRLADLERYIESEKNN